MRARNCCSSRANWDRNRTKGSRRASGLREEAEGKEKNKRLYFKVQSVPRETYKERMLDYSLNSFFFYIESGAVPEPFSPNDVESESDSVAAVLVEDR